MPVAAVVPLLLAGAYMDAGTIEGGIAAVCGNRNVERGKADNDRRFFFLCVNAQAVSRGLAFFFLFFFRGGREYSCHAWP